MTRERCRLTGDSMEVAARAGDSPRVSVITPTYNRTGPLKRAIQSVLAQSFQDFELIVIDDASVQDPADIVYGFADPRIIYLRHPLNRGGAAARNTGISAARGKYIAFLDSDDEWLPRKLERQMWLFQKLPEHFGVIYAGLDVYSPKGALMGRRVPDAAGDIRPLIYAKNCIGPLSTVIVRQSCLERCGCFDEQLPSCQDWDLFIRLAERYHFAYVNGTEVHYHLSEKSITSDMQAKAGGHRVILEKYLPEIQRHSRAHSSHYVILGHYLCRSGQVAKGRRAFFRAIRIYPFVPKYFVYFMCAALGGKAYQRLVTLGRWF